MDEPASDADSTYPVGRADDYTPDAEALISRFQRAIERTPECDDDALRNVLHWSRHTSYRVKIHPQERFCPAKRLRDSNR
jgi:hypothetical protein